MTPASATGADIREHGAGRQLLRTAPPEQYGVG